jgi:hypothetical protein
LGRGRFDVLDFEIQTVADLASTTPRSASRAFGRTDATFPADLIPMWPILTWVNKPENGDPSIVEPIALESPHWTGATASSQSPMTIAAGAAAPTSRRATLIVFYLIGAILRGSLGPQP